MNFALIASTLIIVILIAHNVKRQKKSSEKAEAEFWARERMANSVRRKSLDGLDYITIPLESFPTHILRENSTVAECIETLEALTAQKIVNLTGYTNTDLKLEYGAANITALSEYDQNYTVLVRTLQKWADTLSPGPDGICGGHRNGRQPYLLPAGRILRGQRRGRPDPAVKRPGRLPSGLRS